jgi:hypothetical protein
MRMVRIWMMIDVCGFDRPLYRPKFFLWGALISRRVGLAPFSISTVFSSVAGFAGERRV